jgi:two-component system phosphate regulon response regulator PhoB
MHTIVIADDEASIRTLIETTLESPGCRLLLAENGSIAFEIASREIPDLIVLDWMMPSMTGLEVAERLRQESRTAKIPIILLTAKGQEKDKKMGLEAGVAAYLVKPFSPLELLQIVQQILAGETQGHAKGTIGGTRNGFAFSA